MVPRRRRSPLRWLALALAMIACAPATGRAEIAAWETLREHGREAFRRARYNDALREFEASYHRGGGVRSLVWIGRCHVALGHFDAALYFYRDALDVLDAGA